MVTRFKTKKDDNNIQVASLGKCKLTLNRNDVIKRIEKLTNPNEKLQFNNIVSLLYDLEL